MIEVNEMKWKYKLGIGAAAVLCCLTMVLTASGKTIGWGIPRSQNHEQPWPGKEFEDIIRNNDAVYIGSPDEKILYLTFDAGFENGYMPMILDALKKHEVPALFFLTGHFMQGQPDLVKRMVEEGHIIGNHTYHHPDLTKVTKEKFTEELRLIEDLYKEQTGREMLKVLRPPEGHFNQQVLDWSKELGYYNVMWSLAYIDWNVNAQKGPDHAIEQIMKRLHPGGIILLHSTSSDNGQCLDRLLPMIKDEGYEFKCIQHLISEELPFPIS